VRVYRSAKDWRHVHEVVCAVDDKGTLHLSTIQKQLETSATILPIDSKRYHPYYQYNPGRLTTDELEDLMDSEGYLR
ncbi:hypothetical protein BDQ17DRAFT_1197253, partial [Cyathus striatus]